MVLASLCFPLPGASNLGKMVGNMGLTSLCFPSSLSSPSALFLLCFSPGPSFPFLLLCYLLSLSQFVSLSIPSLLSIFLPQGETEKERDTRTEAGDLLSEKNQAMIDQLAAVAADADDEPTSST